VKKLDGPAAVPASIGDPVAAVERANVLVTAFLAGLLKRKRSIAAALMYILALGRDVRANCWDLSEKAGLEPGDGTFHRLLGRYRWSWERGREMLPLLAQEALGADPDADDEIGPGLAVDETTDLKRGTGTACVSPQHSGVTGKTENCVTWVFSALVTAAGQCWAWFDLYMPECWAADPARRKKAGIPRGLQFATKPELAIAQVRAVIERGVRICWVAADEVYGRSGDFRAACRALFLSYVVIIPCDYKVTLAKGTAKVSAKDAARDAVFERRSAGNGTKGPRYGWWALIATEDPDEFLLVRKLDREKNPYTYYLCHAAPGRPATLNYFVAITGRRWPVETSFKSGKDGFGWDQSQVTTWTAQNRHTLLTALAMIRVIFLRGFLAGGITDAEPLPAPGPAPAGDTEGTADTSLDLRIHPGADTVPAVAGLPCPAGIPPVRLSDTEAARIDALTRAYTSGLLSRDRLAFHFRWSHWRRRHQARARWSHYSTRLAPVTG
jgi:DDE superfamily endonuclease